MHAAMILLAAAVRLSLGHAAEMTTTDGLSLQADLPTHLGQVRIDGESVSHERGGLWLIDPRTGQAPEPGRFDLQVSARVDERRVIISGVVDAAGDEETVCQLQARLPVGQEGWLFWDDANRCRAIQTGESYVQPVYPVCCVTDAERRLGLAVAVAPDPIQPASLGYDPGTRSVVVNWFLGFTPLGRPEIRMRAPFEIEVYRVEPGWAFRSALDGYYRCHPQQFDWRARFEGLWLFASDPASLPNPQHYAYFEGGPPPTSATARGIHTFPYSCTGDLIVALPPEWGVAKTYEDMKERLARWESLPRLDGWEELTPFEVDTAIFRSGQRSLKLHVEKVGTDTQVRQVLELDQKVVDPLTVTVWARAQDVTGPPDAHFGLWVDLFMADGTTQFGKVAAAETGTHDWQELTVTAGEDKPIARANIYLLFRQTHTGTAWFDDVHAAVASAPDVNLVRGPGFESIGPSPKSVFLHDNVMYDEHDRERWFADTWGGADVGPASPINWLRFTLLVNPDQTNPEGRPTASDVDLQMYDRYFATWPGCAGAYLDGTSGACTVTYEYRREHFGCFRDPFQYLGTVYRPCASGKASHIRWVQAFKERYPGKLAFGNVWASNAMFPMCMALDVCGYESSKWYDLAYADYYRAAAYHKPGLLLNYFRIGQQLDTREGGERFFRYATAFGLFPSIGRFTDEAYEKFGDLQHLYVPIVNRLFRAGWEPLTRALADDPAVRVERYGSALPMYLTVLNPTDLPRRAKLRVHAADLGIDGEGLVAVEMVASENLALTSRAGSTAQELTCQLALGPQDVAVVALLPSDGAGDWYRERAAACLQGAAYVYAQEPPTAEAADLAARVRTVAHTDRAQIARRLRGVIADIQRLRETAAQLPADLKRRSYLRELAEAERLITESLLVDTGTQVGWGGERIAPVDGAADLLPTILRGAGVEVTEVRVLPGWVLEPQTPDEGAAGAQGMTRLACPPERAWTGVACIRFAAADGQPAMVERRGHVFYGPVCELQASVAEEGRQVVVRLRNADLRPRTLSLVVTAPEGVHVAPDRTGAELAPGSDVVFNAQVAFTGELPSGTYPLQIEARSETGAVVQQTTLPLVFVTPLEPGNLASSGNAATVAVDSAYYAYSERPLNDGVVNPVGVPFNEAAWASAETEGEHWVEVQWPTPQTVSRVAIYWNVENDVVWTSRHVSVQVREGETWRTVAVMQPVETEPVSTCSFAPATTRALRFLQAKGGGPVTRPNIMWLREVAVYP